MLDAPSHLTRHANDERLDAVVQGYPVPVPPRPRYEAWVRRRGTKKVAEPLRAGHLDGPTRGVHLHRRRQCLHCAGTDEGGVVGRGVGERGQVRATCLLHGNVVESGDHATGDGGETLEALQKAEDVAHEDRGRGVVHVGGLAVQCVEM